MKIGWIDFSPTDRRRVLDVLSMNAEKGATDELGIGSIRDAFANYFFPGTSTIQTRAKYFLLVPYILQELDYSKRFDEIEKELYKLEQECCRKLAENSSDLSGSGIIGHTQKDSDEWVLRKPSDIYWHGIKRWGILSLPGDNVENVSIGDYIRFRQQMNENGKKQKEAGKLRVSSDDANDDMFHNGGHGRFSWAVSPPPNWFNDLDIELTPGEAECLRGHISKYCNGSLLHTILEKDIAIDCIDNIIALADKVSKDVDDYTRGMLELACKFSEFVYVARICYNRIRTEDTLGADEWKCYDGKLPDVANFDVVEIMRRLDVSNPKLRNFICDLQEAYRKEDYDKICNIIIARENEIKDKRAKLAHPDANIRDWIGGRQLDYRWNTAKRLINDIRNPKC